MHNPVKKYTPGRTHNHSIHVWVHPSVAGYSFGGKLFVDGSLIENMERRVAKLGGQLRKSTRPLMSWFAQRMVPCRSRSQRSDVSCGQSFGHCGRPLPCQSQERRSFLTAQRCSKASNADRNGAQQREGHMLTCGYESRNTSETLGMKPTSTL